MEDWRKSVLAQIAPCWNSMTSQYDVTICQPSGTSCVCLPSCESCSCATSAETVAYNLLVRRPGTSEVSRVVVKPFKSWFGKWFLVHVQLQSFRLNLVHWAFYVLFSFVIHWNILVSILFFVRSLSGTSTRAKKSIFFITSCLHLVWKSNVLCKDLVMHLHVHLSICNLNMPLPPGNPSGIWIFRFLAVLFVGSVSPIVHRTPKSSIWHFLFHFIDLSEPRPET